MTALMQVQQLTEQARIFDHPEPSSSRTVLALHWTIDPRTGRPVSRWSKGVVQAEAMVCG